MLQLNSFTPDKYNTQGVTPEKDALSQGRLFQGQHPQVQIWEGIRMVTSGRMARRL